MKKILAAALLASFIANPAMASSACYTPWELRAEQLLRLHSELMVITVTCRTGSRGENLVSAYTGFTHANIDVLHNAEQTMMRYYAARHGGNGISQLDKLRTRLGNEYGQAIADMSAPAYCKRYRDKVLAVRAETPAQLQREVSYMVATAPSFVPPCDSETRMAARIRR